MVTENQKDINNINQDVAIIGIGFKIPSSSSSDSNVIRCLSTPSELYESLLNGFNGVSSTSIRWSDNYFKNGELVNKSAGLLPLDEIKSFDPIFFGLNPSDAVSIDPQQRLLLKCVWNALEDSGIDPITIRGTETSVFMGATMHDYLDLNKYEKDNSFIGIQSSNYSVSNRISYCFDLRGESITIDTACSSSLNAITLGYKSIIHSGSKSKLSIVGGVNLILNPQNNELFSHFNMLGESGRCNSFSSEADGFVRSEAAGVVILKNLKEAINDGNKIYCVIKGANSNIDGNFDKINYSSPSKSSQAQNIVNALKSTNGTVLESDIDYFECHGTGTPTGDPIECEGISIALNRSIKSNQLLIGSIKSNIGHGESSSGVAGLIKCCLMFKNKTFVPNINFKTPNPSIKFNEWNLKVVTEPIPFTNKQTIMAINNFGVTGSNCCIILSEYLNSGDSSTTIPNNISSNNKKYIIPISSNSSTSLDNYKSLISSLSTKSSSNFIDFVYQQINNKSTSLIQRSSIIASNWDEFNNQDNELKSITINKLAVSNITILKKNPLTIFVFCGQGSQYNKMALSLYESETVFKSSIDKLDKELSKYYGYSVLDKLRSINDNDTISIHQPILAIPVNVMVQVSLYELYKHWGVKADIVVGHSFGEIASSYCSGMIDFETLCYITYHRSVAQNKTIGTGRMLSINISVDEYLDKYSNKHPSIEIACYNSPTSIVIAGNEDQLNLISNELKSSGVFCAMLGSLSSFHTSSQLMIKDDICSLNFKSKPSTIPIFSTVTSNLFNNQTTPFNSNYLFENVIKPVNFTSTISNIYKYIESNDMGNEITFIEIAPHPTLQYYLNQMKSQQSDYFIKGEKISIYSALNKKKNDYNEFLKTISTLYVNGYNNINFKSQIINNNNNSQNNKYKIELPLYQWDDKEYYKIHSSWVKVLKEGSPINHLGNSNDSPFKSYQTNINTRNSQFQWLKGHSMKGKCVFPGMGYISNLLSIYNMDQDITINDIHFKTAFNLTDGINNTLQTTIIPLTKNEYNIKYHFKDLKTNEWVLCAIGNYNLFKHQINHSINGGKLNIEQLKSKCNYTTISRNELYNTIKIKTGLQYKGLFQGVKECFIGNGCSLSIVSLNEIQNQSEFNHLLDNNSLNQFFNTAILDTCVHGILIIREQSQLYFDKCEGFKYYSDNIINASKQQHQEVYVYSEIKSINSSTINGSLKIMLADGTLLIEIQNAVCKSTIPIIDSTSVIQPSKDIYTPYLQSKDSLISSPSTFKHLYKLEEYQCKELDNIDLVNKMIYYLYYKYINIRCPSHINKETIETLELDKFKELANPSINQYCIQFVYECLKMYLLNSSGDQNEINGILEDNKFKYSFLIDKTTRIMAKLLFPLEDDDQYTYMPQSLFENGLLNNIYETSDQLLPVNNLLSKIVSESVKPIINQTSTFRILEAGSGVGSLSILILNLLEQLLQDTPSYRIDIEFTFTDISTTFISDAKEKLSKFKKINIVYRLLDLEKELVDLQNYKPQYYDMVVMTNVLHVVKDIRISLNEIYKVLKPNGQLLFVEPPYKKIMTDSILGIFPQWWAFNDDIRTDRCCVEHYKWYSLLESCNFKDIIISEGETVQLLIQTRKPSQQELLTEDRNSATIYNQLKSYGQIILYLEKDQNNSEIVNLIKSLSIPIIIVNNINQFNQLIKSSSINNNNSLIIFLKSLNQLNINNYKEITFEYIQINQILLKLEIENNYKIVLITNNSRSTNYLSNSLIGTSKYLFHEFPTLDIVSIDFDTTSINNHNKALSIINNLINSSENIEREYYIIDNQIYAERYKKEINIKNHFKSNTIQNNKDELMVQLDTNLEYKLKPRKQELAPNQVEIQIKATGINYKDYATYIGLIDLNLKNTFDLNSKNEDDDPNFSNVCFDFSGTVSRVGSNVRKFRIGDQVFGNSSKAASSHIVIDEKVPIFKPSNISHVEAASLPTIYATSLHSIYTIGNLKKYETILIHSTTGGVGLSALEVLKWKDHKGYIFATVGSDEKAEYLRKTYGSLITDIYSTRDRNYEIKIIDKLKSLGCDEEHQGVDLILNTLSSEYIGTNFNCLNSLGRIVDLSVTHLTPFDYMDYNRFKFNYSYENVEISKIPFKLLKYYLKKIIKAFSNGKIKFVPIIEFSNLETSKAINYVNQRKHIGKIVVNHNVDIIDQLYNKYQQQIDNDQILMKDKYNISNLNLGKNILLTGQTGIILIILRWLINHSNESIDNIIIVSKSKLKWELELIINETHNKIKNKTKIHYKQVDIGNNDEVEAYLTQLEKEYSINDINSIFHFAFINDIGDMDKVDMDRMNIAHNAKVIGAINLHNQSLQRKWNINQFVLASSITSIFGIEKQCCYVNACSVLDSLSKYRKSIGLPSLTINIGAVVSTGFVSRSDSVEVNLSNSDISFITPQSFIGTLDLLIQNSQSYSNYAHSGLNLKNLGISKNPMILKFDFQSIFNSNVSRLIRDSNEDNIDGLFITKISDLLSIEEAKINVEHRLIDYGIDSLVIVNLKNWIDEKFQVKISIQSLQNNKIVKVFQIIKNELNKINGDLIKPNLDIKMQQQKDNESAVSLNQFTEEFIQNEIRIPNDSSIKSRPYNISNILNQSNQSILLTGATGYLGAYLLIELVKLDTIKSVYCITRNKTNSTNLLDDIISNLKKHQLYQYLISEQLNKIKAIKGDITSNNLGLSNNDYSIVSKECSIIINSAADLNLQQPYEQSKPGNVNCIKEIIKLSISNENQQKLIINFSSITVFFNHKLNGQEYDENTVQPQLGNINMGYVQSKIIAEKLLKYYGGSFGIPSIVFRLPELWANPTTGIGNDNDTLQTIIQSFAAIGGYTNNSNSIFCSPITTISKYIIKMIFNTNSWSTSTSSIYSLNGDSVYYNIFFEILEEHYNCKETESNELLSLIQKSTHKSSMKFNTFDNIKEQSFLNSISVDKGFLMSKSTHNLLKSIDPNFKYNDFNINKQMIINHLNYSLNKQ